MARSLKVGVQLPEVEYIAPWRQMRDMVMAIEDVGLDSIWVGDHLMYRTDDDVKGPWEAWSMLAAIAAVTSRVDIGPLVASTSFHNPTMIAKKASTIDEISDGRLILGLGSGWNRTEYEAYGFPFDRRVSRFEEAFTIIRTLLTDGEIDFHGEFYTASDCVLVPPARPESIPLMVGSDGPRMLAATLPYVQMWNAWHSRYGNTVEGAEQLLAQFDAACVANGVDAATIEKTLAVLVQAPGGTERQHGGSDRATASPVTGGIGAVVEHLQGLAALGVTHVQLVVDPITTDSVRWLAGVVASLD